MIYNYINFIHIIILTFYFVISEEETSQSTMYSLIDYPEINYCFSSMDILDGSQSSSFAILKRELSQNCTHVYGNIVIRNIFSNDSQLNLNFLSSIKEITGSLKIHNSNISIIPLHNLRVIRGNSKLHNHDILEGLQNSLDITWDISPSKITTINTIIDLRSLRSIVNGNIVISDVYCRTLSNIDWNELLEDPNRQSVLIPCKGTSLMCSNECPLKNGKRFCWGSSNSQCQIFSKCRKRMCANRCFLSKTGDEECCNSQCLGGCTSSTANSCIACQGVLDGSFCKAECPPKKIFNRENGIFVENKNFRPLFVNVCLKKCPADLLEQEGECKSQCTFKHYERKGSQCVPCQKFCEQLCTKADIFSSSEISYQTIALDAIKIRKLANCTTFKGSIHIDAESFENDNPITSAVELTNLNNLRNISGSVYIDMSSARFTLNNLSFLSNLEVIEGYFDLMVPVILGIYNTKISFLGLTNLKSVGLQGNRQKPIVIQNNPNLCYFDQEKFKKFLNLNTMGISGIGTTELCEKQGKVCDKECDSSLGCWGPGPTQCRKCINMKLGKLCAKDCMVEHGYLPNTDSKNGICVKCHKECAKTCSGLGADQCIGGCKNAMENNICVSKCSRTHYLDNISKKCEPCHPDCHQRNITREPICSGPLPKPGPNGCHKCLSIILDKKFELERCFINSILSGYFSENHPNNINSTFSKFTEKYTDLIVLFRPCHQLCTKCTFVTDQRIRTPTTHWNGCIHCNGFWFENTCVASCTLNLTFMRMDKFNTSKGQCLRCHSQCNGCFDEGNERCKSCNNFKISSKTNLSQFECVENCPQNSIATDTECIKVHLTKLELILVILAMIFFMCLLIFVIIITKFIHIKKEKRQKEKLKAYFSNANEKDCNEINDKPSPPNMNYLLVISSDNLEFNNGKEILGKGTFGSVYAGKWKPDCNAFDDSSSMNSCKDKKVDVVFKVLNGSCDLDQFMNEVRIMASVRHKHCLRLIGVSFKGDQKLLISSFMPLGSMDKYLANNKRNLTSQILLLWAEQIANGMLYLELNHIIHRDLATRNVLIHKVSHVQITDFGLSKIINPNMEEIQIFGGMVPIRWLAIETLRDGIYSHKTDVWAYAVTLWEIFSFAKIPYETIKANEIRDEIIKGTRLCQPEICSLDIYILMLKCWSMEPEDRPTFEFLWSDFKMYCNNSETYLSHPNIETQYKHKTLNNFISDDKSSNNSLQSRRGFMVNPLDIIIPDSIRPLLTEQPRRNLFYQPANDIRMSETTLNGSYGKYNGHLNFQDHQIRRDLSSSPFTKEYLEPLTTRT